MSFKGGGKPVCTTTKGAHSLHGNSAMEAYIHQLVEEQRRVDLMPEPACLSSLVEVIVKSLCAAMEEVDRVGFTAKFTAESLRAELLSVRAHRLGLQRRVDELDGRMAAAAATAPSSGETLLSVQTAGDAHLAAQQRTIDALEVKVEALEARLARMGDALKD